MSFSRSVNQQRRMRDGLREETGYNDHPITSKIKIEIQTPNISMCLEEAFSSSRYCVKWNGIGEAYQSTHRIPPFQPSTYFSYF